METFEIYSQKMSLEKSGEEVDGLIPVKIKINSPTPDKENERILLQAFDEETIKDFLANGVIDYDHESVRGQTAEDRAKAIIGQPKKFYIENGAPVVEAVLFKKNPYVQNAILPAIENGENVSVWKASVGGGIIKKSTQFDPKLRNKINNIEKIKLVHIAITPNYKAVHPDTYVKMIKSINIDGMFTSPNKIIFNDFEPFCKALTSGYITDMEGMTGGQVLNKQSLEENIIENNPIFIIEDVLNYIKKTDDIITYDRIIGYLEGKGLSFDVSQKIINYLVEQTNIFLN
ncbi:MAG: hypothetical protein SNJ64_05205 [Endomicrobiia bacterium]